MSFKQIEVKGHLTHSLLVVATLLAIRPELERDSDVRRRFFQKWRPTHIICYNVAYIFVEKSMTRHYHVSDRKVTAKAGEFCIFA